MNGRHTIFDTRRQATDDFRNMRPALPATTKNSIDSAFLADRGEKPQPAPSITNHDLKTTRL
jgi:hypothetical protein